MILELDPILMGGAFPLPNGRVIWHLPELPEDATDEQRQYRRWALARLDLYGHDVVVGSQADLALAASEAHDDG